MPRKPANPYSKYSKRKAQEEYYRTRAKMTNDEKFTVDSWVFIILLIIAIVVFLVSGMDGLAKWVS